VGAGKSFARPGRKQATATKLGIYSPYSPRSSIHFLARCSNFCKPLKKKKSSRLSVQPVLRGSNELPFGRKMTMEAQVGQFLLDCKCRVSRGIVVQEQDSLGELLAAFFLQNVLQLHQQRWVILRIDSLALWKIINEVDAVFIPKNQGEKFSSGILHSEFLGYGEPLCRHSIDCCFVSGT